MAALQRALPAHTIHYPFEQFAFVADGETLFRHDITTRHPENQSSEDSKRDEDLRIQADERLDEALAGTFPASDPV